MLGSREIYVWTAKCESTRRTLSVVSFQIRLKCALLVCLSLLLETEEEFRTAIENKKKTRDAGFSTKIYAQIGDLNPAWNQIIWRSPWSSITQLLQVITLVTFFFLSFFFLQKTCFNGLHLQAVQRRLKEMRVRMAEDLCQRIVSAEAKWSFPLLALKKGIIILPKFFFFGQMQAIYQRRRVPNNLLIVGTFSEALVTLASPPFPPQTKLNSEPNRKPK